MLEAFKTRQMHWDQDKKRMSIKDSSAARWPPRARNVA